MRVQYAQRDCLFSTKYSSFLDVAPARLSGRGQFLDIWFDTSLLKRPWSSEVITSTVEMELLSAWELWSLRSFSQRTEFTPLNVFLLIPLDMSANVCVSLSLPSHRILKLIWAHGTVFEMKVGVEQFKATAPLPIHATSRLHAESRLYVDHYDKLVSIKGDNHKRSYTFS